MRRTMNYRVDYHVHTVFSHDCDALMSDQCARAVNIGLKEIAFTEHAEYDPDDPAHGYFRPAEYFREIELCRERFGDRLIIRAGVEVGSPHTCATKIRNLQRKYPVDFIIGSLHVVNGRSVTYESYPEGHSEAALYPAYFRELLELAKHGDYDVIGHLDICKRYGTRRFGRFVADAYAEPIHEVLHAAIGRERGIEINCSGLHQTCGDTFPALQVLQWYREMGGKILTIGTDSHRTEHTGVGLEDGLRLARRAGFTASTIFERRRPQWIDL